MISYVNRMLMHLIFVQSEDAENDIMIKPALEEQ